MARGSASLGRLDWSTWPRYDAAVVGFPEYWYPAIEAGKVRGKPVPLTLAGQELVLIRDGGKVYALHDRCLHRGVPLSLGAGTFGGRTYSRQVFPGTLSCGYHGWTYDLRSGTLVAALTDGPDSPICGKVRVRTYPAEERFGIVWVWMGEGSPPPLDEDLPEDLLKPDAVVGGVRASLRDGNWRYAAENGFDEPHPRFLHRNSLWQLFNRQPGWIKTHVEASPDGKWLKYLPDEVHFEDDFPGLGRWPIKRWWEVRKGGPRISIRMPCTLRVHYGEWIHFAWYVPVDEGHHRYFQFAVKRTSGWDAVWFKLRYRLYIRRIFHTWFSRQDGVMLAAIKAPPERLFRPDATLIAWRKLCEGARRPDGEWQAPSIEPETIAVSYAYTEEPGPATVIGPHSSGKSSAS
ncbi:MAG TPA: aromatic ring-hydroxylating dioxygenase subunit alpha [Chloroflexota bacterium]|nr:aromatic ring-hydroxylating dioxygenase subunit alpha [Chloroflexota bacterium]